MKTLEFPRGILEPVSPAEEIARTFALLVEPGDVHEVRMPKAGRHGTISGYFDDGDALVKAIAPYDGKVPGIYITLNPCNPALKARACNRLQTRATITTADPDILRRRWLLIDCDPRRPAGISSTDDEHGRAITTACGIWDDLHAAGWPDPVVADSGNGAHLLYRVDLANTPESTELIRELLKGISGSSAPDDVDVDLSVFNAARITKLYGTMTRKGDDLPERPHRPSRLLEIPDPLQTVGRL
jgi:hypothetical protein